MTTGIYKLTFSSGDTYIGKSVDIENRWKQHADKMRKGTAAKLMQDAYSAYGFPKGEVLCQCHENHLDIAEAAYINRRQPSLNTSIPKDQLAGLSTEECDNVLDNLGYSTLEMLITLTKLGHKDKEATNKIHEQRNTIEELNDELLCKRTDEEIQQDITGTIVRLTTELHRLSRDNRKLLNRRILLDKECLELRKYKELPWWKKIFN